MNNKFYIFIYKLHVYVVTSIRRCMLQLTIYYSSKKVLTLGNTCVPLLTNKGKKMFFLIYGKDFLNCLFFMIYQLIIRPLQCKRKAYNSIQKIVIYTDTFFKYNIYMY